ncbi:MAG: hypothetical protein L0215_11605 [Gemmataceae bacterium]|nr:hypothetical protein [Gemmataceae bacterium]
MFWPFRKHRGNSVGNPIQRRANYRPWLEALEERWTPATIIWDGGGADNLASNAQNWVNDLLPGAGDTIAFDATSSKAATIDAAFTVSVAGMQLAPGYNSTVTLARNFTVTNGLTQMGSTITGSSNLTLQGSSMAA